jgi:hypothetical protein
LSDSNSPLHLLPARLCGRQVFLRFCAQFQKRSSGSDVPAHSRPFFGAGYHRLQTSFKAGSPKPNCRGTRDSLLSIVQLDRALGGASLQLASLFG